MNNSLFQNYAEIVEALFSPGKRPGNKISISPAPPQEPGGRPPGALPHGPLAEHIDPQGLQVMQALVDHLRRAWVPPLPTATERPQRRRAEEQTDSAGPPAGQEPLPQAEAEQVKNHFTRFREAISSGDERPLQRTVGGGNPFYELTQLVFHHHLQAAKRLFHSMQGELLSSPPEAVPLLRSFRDIWFGQYTHLTVGRGAIGQSTGLLRKLSDQIDSWMGMGKVLVAVVLFFGSSFTTAQGINDLLQSQEISQLSGGLFDGREAEVLRYGLAVLVGLLLSSAILDYKERIFTSIAEEGGVLRGLRMVVLRHPRWMILATLLTAFSIKTNYDGIVSLISKKADLAQQSEQIRSRVKKAMGSPFFVNVVEPDDLHDVQGLLQSAAEDSIQKFNRVPDDEVSGVASSGDPRMGPRYWGKYYIVNGGYVPGVRDVAHSTQSLTAGFSGRIDEMLRASGLDLSRSAADKIRALRERYDNHLQKSVHSVETRLDNLRGLMEMRGYSLEEIKRVFALEHYQINEIVLSIAETLEENKKEYEQVAAELNRLTDAYVAVLQQVDKSGSASRREYHIEGKLAIPDLDAIKELKNTKIPKATHKSFAELKEFLAHEYGVALANGLLLAILFVSFCMDLLDPLVYSRWTAIIGRQDRAMYPDLLGYLREWENDFIVGCHQFFYRRDVQQVFHGLAMPNRTGIRNAFYLLMEEVDPHLKEPIDRTLLQNGQEWFVGLFRLTRTRDVGSYNRRAVAIGRFVAGQDRYLQQLLEYLLPGVRFDQGVGRDPFLLVSKKTERVQEQHRSLFAWELQAVSGQLTAGSLAGHDQGIVSAAPLDAMLALEQKRKNIVQLRKGRDASVAAPTTTVPPKSDPEEDFFVGALPLTAEQLKACVRPEGEPGPLLRLFFRPGSPASRRWALFWGIAFAAPYPPFAHTRRRWLQEVARLDGRSLKDMEGLYDFVPDLKRVLLETIPGIRRDVIGPLTTLQQRFPNRCQEGRVAPVEELEKRVELLEKDALQVLGLSPSMGDQTRLYTPAAGVALELEGVSRVVLDHVGGDPSGFQEQAATLVSDAHAQLGHAQAIEEAVNQEMLQILKDIKRSHESIKQILLKINMSSTTTRKSSMPLRDMLRLLRQNKDILEQTPQQSESILRAAEQFFYGKAPDSYCTETSLVALQRLQTGERQLLNGLLQILVDVQGAESPAELTQRLRQEEPEHDEATTALLSARLPFAGLESDAAPMDRRGHAWERDAAAVDQEERSDPIPSPAAGVAESGSAWAQEVGEATAYPTMAEEDAHSTDAESYAEELSGSTLLVHESHADLQGPERRAFLSAQSEERGAENPEPERSGMEGFFHSTEDAANPLIVVAEFTQWQPDATAATAVRSAGSKRGGSTRKRPAQWHLQPLPPAQEDTFFGSGGLITPTVSGNREAARQTALPLPAVAKPRVDAVALSEEAAVPAATSLEFRSKSGLNFRGVAKDVSLNGCYAGSMDLTQVHAQDTGRLRLVSDVGVHQFPCEVVEVSESAEESSVTLRLFANGHQFESVTKEKIFKEVWRAHQATRQGRSAPPAEQLPPIPPWEP
ncbi:MAG: hypothetical protein HQL88_08755 [Magnetococcales bacterium]|nr:hypothetical protein [Magnetococcales bacterium]